MRTALSECEKALREQAKACGANDALDALFGGERRSATQVEALLERVRSAASVLHGTPATADGDYFVRLKAESAATMKAAATLRVEQLSAHAKVVAADPDCAQLVAEADAQILLASRVRDHALFMGVEADREVLERLRPGPQAVPELPDPAGYEAVLALGRYAEAQAEAAIPLDVADPELLRRCGDLYAKFMTEGSFDRLDTVVTEATRIYEDRLRKLTNAPKTTIGVDLATYAFGGSGEPRLKMSDVKAEQEGAYFEARGLFAWTRNRVHHHLQGELEPRRVRQTICHIDRLIWLAESVARAKGDP